MTGIRNVLFIMSDQLRADYLSCYGHPTLKTPHIDGLARRAVTYTRAYLTGTALRSGAHVVLHGSLDVQPRVDLELRALVDPRTVAGRSAQGTTA